MKVLSIKQPWASLIIYGYKKYEFRTWQTHHKGELLIHASKTIEKKYIEKFKDLNIPFETGKIIGQVKLEKCIKLDPTIEKEIIKENPFVYGHTTNRGGYAWKISKPRVIEPIEIKGKLNLWNYEIDK